LLVKCKFISQTWYRDTETLWPESFQLGIRYVVSILSGNCNTAGSQQNTHTEQHLPLNVADSAERVRQWWPHRVSRHEFICSLPSPPPQQVLLRTQHWNRISLEAWIYVYVSLCCDACV